MSKSKEATEGKVPEYVHKAQAKALEAEAEANRELARMHAAEATKAEHGVKVSEFVLARETRKRTIELVGDEFQHIYRFTGVVDPTSAAKCMETLTRWSRTDPRCPIEIVFFSPGGSVVDGMALFDTILQLRANGHHVTTTAIGMAASMGGILLQAGDVRRMSSEAWVLIHEISARTGGSMGQIEDEVEWMKRVQERILDIFADRSKRSKAKKPLTRPDFKERWRRTDWWISSPDCLKFGIVDEVL